MKSFLRGGPVERFLTTLSALCSIHRLPAMTPNPLHVPNDTNHASPSQGRSFDAAPVEPEEAPTYAPRARESYWRRIGGGSLFLSLLVHGLLGGVALLVITFALPQAPPQPPDFSMGGGARGNAADKMANKRKSVTMQVPKTRIAANVSTSAVTLPDVQIMTLDTTITGCPMPSGRGLRSGTGLHGLQGDRLGIGTGPGKGLGFFWGVPAIMRSRCSPAERTEKMRQNGGTEECEKAVVRSLDWLKSKQNPDGSWGTTFQSAMTGMALLSYYGHCETPESPFYGQSVMSGITFLTDLGMKNRGFLSKALGIDAHCVYEHGIGCYALGETYSFSKLGTKELPGLREIFEKGVKIIVDNQIPNGSWAYGQNVNSYVREGGGDLSVTGWQFQALKAAKHTNLKIDGLATALKKTADYLQKMQTPDGGFGSQAPRGTEPYTQYTMTGIGVLGLQTLGNGNTGSANKGLRFLENDLSRDPLDWRKNANLYCWYYNTQAFFQKGGKEWERWNAQCRTQILNNQNPAGDYRPEVGTEPAATTSVAGGDADLYRTCMCTLMLEVYYRYLKVGNGLD